jgi:tetratricopeptide (TPR) repeat protein
MGHRNFNDRQAIFELASKYEDMSFAGAVFLSEGDYNKLINYYEEEYLLDRAIDVADCAIAQYGFTADFYIRKAELLIASDKEEYAMGALDQAELYAPNDIVVSLLRSEALTSLDLFDEALQLLERLKEGANSKELSNIYVYESLVYEAMEEHERMFYSLKAALYENPQSKDALERMWICVELSKRYHESIELHERILEEDPYSYLAWYNLGAAYAYYGNYADAIEAYEYAYLINEKFEFAYRDCAEICYELKSYQKALTCYQETLVHFEPDEDIFLRIGQCYQQLGNTVIAKTFYEKTAQMNPYNDEVWYHIGECYAKNEQWHKAIGFFKRASSIDDRREEYYSALADAYYQVGDYRKAEPLFIAATEAAPEQNEYWLKYGFFLMEQERYEDAVDLFDEAEIHAVDTAFLYCKSVCLFRMARRKEALYLLGDALDENFAMHDSLFDLMPGLMQDSDVQAIIATYQPY